MQGQALQNGEKQSQVCSGSAVGVSWMQAPAYRVSKRKGSNCWGCPRTTACVLSRFSHVQLFVTPWTVAHQSPLSMGFSRQNHWSGLPCPPPGGLPDTDQISPLMSLALAREFCSTSTTWEALCIWGPGEMMLARRAHSPCSLGVYHKDSGPETEFRVCVPR